MLDDDTRENEGDLIGIGSKMTPENVNSWYQMLADFYVMYSNL